MMPGTPPITVGRLPNTRDQGGLEVTARCDKSSISSTYQQGGRGTKGECRFFKAVCIIGMWAECLLEEKCD